jgi:hypothetical protein
MGMTAGSLEARLSNLEELAIIIIIVVFGGGRGGGGGGGPIPDPLATDTSRLEALMRRLRPTPGDSFASDIPRLSAEAVESRLLEVSAELTRLRSQEGELNTRLKELRGSSSKSK